MQAVLRSDSGSGAVWLIVVGLALQAPSVIGADLLSDDFEGYAPGTSMAGIGTNGWGASDASVVVQTNQAYASDKAVAVAEAVLSNTTHSTASSVWTDVRLLAVPGAPPAADAPFDAYSEVYINDGGYVTVRTNGGWDVCSDNFVGQPLAPVSNDWVRLTLHGNGTSRELAVFLDGELLREQVPFLGTSTNYAGFELSNQDEDGAYLDDALVTTNLPAGLTVDADGDGMADAEEVHLYGEASGGHFAPSTLPFEDGFEDYAVGVAIDDLGHFGWGASDSTVFVQTNQTHQGANAAVVSEGSTVSNVVSTVAPKVWTDMWLVPTLGAAPVDQPTDANFEAYFNADGFLVVATNGGWDICSSNVMGHAVAPVTGSWVRVTVCHAVDASQTAVFLRGELLRQELAPLGSATGYASLELLNSNESAYLDDVRVQAKFPPGMDLDLDGDAVSDAFEIDRYGNLSSSHGGWRMIIR